MDGALAAYLIRPDDRNGSNGGGGGSRTSVLKNNPVTPSESVISNMLALPNGIASAHFPHTTA